MPPYGEAGRDFVNHEKHLLAHAKTQRQKMPDAERELWYHLRNRRLGGYKFRRQEPIGTYIADFICHQPKLVVEADGSQHLERATYDATRTRYLESCDYSVLRFWNHDILQHTDAVLETILRKLEELDGR